MPAGLHFFLEALGEDVFPCLFQPLEVVHIPGLGSPSIFKTCNGQVFLTSHHITLTLTLLPLHIERPLCLHWTHFNVINSVRQKVLWEEVNSGLFLTAFTPLHETVTWFLHCSALLFGLLLLRLSQKHRNPCGMSKVFSGILLQKTWRSQPSRSPPLISHPPLFWVSLRLSSHLNRLLTRIPSSRLPGSSLPTLLGSNSYCPVKHSTDICSPRAFQDLPLKANEGAFFWDVGTYLLPSFPWDCEPLESRAKNDWKNEWINSVTEYSLPPRTLGGLLCLLDSIPHKTLRPWRGKGEMEGRDEKRGEGKGGEGSPFYTWPSSSQILQMTYLFSYSHGSSKSLSSSHTPPHPPQPPKDHIPHRNISTTPLASLWPLPIQAFVSHQDTEGDHVAATSILHAPVLKDKISPGLPQLTFWKHFQEQASKNYLNLWRIFWF